MPGAPGPLHSENGGGLPLPLSGPVWLELYREDVCPVAGSRCSRLVPIPVRRCGPGLR